MTDIPASLPDMIPPAIGPRLQRARKTKSFTLEQLSERSGVSHSMLSQIERGAANPTFATLWALTKALDLDLADLASNASEVKPDPVYVVPPHFTPEICSSDDLTRLRLLGPAESIGRLEWYELRIEPGGRLVSDAHAHGTHEHLTVLAGELTVRAGDAEEHVSSGATARYRADRAHAIFNSSGESARALLVVVNH